MSQVAKYSDLYPLMITELKGCPEANRLQAIQIACREFCRKSNVWQEWLDPTSLREDQDRYTLCWDYEASILRVMEVRLLSEDDVTNGTDGTKLDPSEYDLDLCVLKKVRDVLVLDTAAEEDVEKGLLVKVSFLPDINSTCIQRSLFDRWAEGINAYAMAYLLKMPGTKWSNPKLAGFYDREYTDKLVLAKGEQRRDFKDPVRGITA